MELIERSGYLDTLQKQLNRTATGEGHTLFICGEAGIGKTSLLKAFCEQQNKQCIIYQGACDSLFTPRPLAPVYDIGWQIRKDFWDNGQLNEDRSVLFSRLLNELSRSEKPILLIFEDIHWADEATLDFIKFLARRINRLRCLFILTYRDNEINSRHPLKSVMGQLPPGSYSRLQLDPLSRSAVDSMAAEKGYNGKDVYTISGGNPFYVTEILASYSYGIPDNIKDAVLSVYNGIEDETRIVWDLLSVIPAGLEIDNLVKAEPGYARAIENCMDKKIIILDKGIMYFKHELYRRTVEESLSPFKRVSLNKKVLDVLLQHAGQEGMIERIVHHAKNANEYETVVKYAPLAAQHAASVNAHIESAKLYFTAIEYYQGNDKAVLIQFYEAYAYECYLTNKMKDAIIYQAKSLAIREETDSKEEIANCMRSLSRFWWYDGNRKQAEVFGERAVSIIEDQPVSRIKAMAYSNMSQLKMLAYQVDDCLYWGDKAIAMAKELNDDEILAHALNNVGTVQLSQGSMQDQGIQLLQQSLDIALNHAYHEHAARAYTNLSSTHVINKRYAAATAALDEGIRFCEGRDLDSWSAYMLSWKARLKMETGKWAEAFGIAQNLLLDDSQAIISRLGALTVRAILSMRKGDADPLADLEEAKKKALETKEYQRIIPVLSAMLEYEWIYGKTIVEQEYIDHALAIARATDNACGNSEAAFWLMLVRQQSANFPSIHEGYDFRTKATLDKAVVIWQDLGCPYHKALALFQGSNADKKEALMIVHELGATPVYNKMKQAMRKAGIKSIPRGIRATTKTNPAFLTSRELDILNLLHEGLQNKEIGSRLFISAKTVDHHISSILFKLDVNSRTKAVQEAHRLQIIK